MNRMKELRQELGKNMKEAATLLKIPYTTYVNYEKGMREPNSEMLIAIADFYGCSIDYLLGKTDVRNGEKVVNITPMPGTHQIPRLGRIACGEPILAEENLEGYDTAPDWVHCDFSLTCRGDSMIGAGIHDGDIVFIKAQPEVEPGQIAAVQIGEEATLKRVYPMPDGVMLLPENPQFKPMTYTGAEAEQVRILGLATHCISCIK